MDIETSYCEVWTRGDGRLLHDLDNLDDLDNLVERFMSDHETLVGYSLVSGHLRSLGLRVQRDRIRESISRVDPGNSRICWAVVFSRRA